MEIIAFSAIISIKITKIDFLEIPLSKVPDCPRHENPGPNQKRPGFLPRVDASREGEHHIQVDKVVGGEMPKHFDEIEGELEKHEPKDQDGGSHGMGGPGREPDGG